MNSQNKLLKNLSVILITIFMILLMFQKVGSTYFYINKITIQSIQNIYLNLEYFFIVLVLQISICTILCLCFTNNSVQVEMTSKENFKNKLVPIIGIIILFVLYIQIAMKLFSISLIPQNTLVSNFNSIEDFICILFGATYIFVAICTLIIINFKSNIKVK